MTDTYDGDTSDSIDNSNETTDALADTVDTMEGDDASAAEAAALDAAGVEPLTDLFEDDVDIAPGNLGLDTKTGPGWGVEYHGQTEVDGELTDVTFNMKSDEAGEVTDYLVSSGHNARGIHDSGHGHAYGQNTDNPGHEDRGHGVFDE